MTIQLYYIVARGWHNEPKEYDFRVDVEPEDIIAFIGAKDTKESCAAISKLMDMDLLDTILEEDDFIEFMKERKENDLLCDL